MSAGPRTRAWQEHEWQLDGQLRHLMKVFAYASCYGDWRDERVRAQERSEQESRSRILCTWGMGTAQTPVLEIYPNTPAWGSATADGGGGSFRRSISAPAWLEINMKNTIKHEWRATKIYENYLKQCINGRNVHTRGCDERYVWWYHHVRLC